MNVFVTVCEEGGFAAASRKLDISPAAVTRAIFAIEKQLGVQLLQRTTRNVRLTDAGHQYFDDVRSILSSINDANNAALGINAEPRGTLNVTASVLFGRSYVMPLIVEYMLRFPHVKVVAHFVDRVTNIVDEGIDVAIRIGHLPDSSLRAVQIGQIKRVLCASPAYLKKFGVPSHPTELNQHTIIASSPLSPSVEWQFQEDMSPLSVHVNPRLTVTSNDAALVAAVCGLGITRLLSYQVINEVKQGDLRLILEEYAEDPWPVHVMHRESKYGSSKVRSFIDFIVAKLREQNIYS